ncbi:ERF family protein [Leptotrichia sp. OH3620_COT-345]|uniref:ERF family protein n=1 Tax=Leptotrichia sp. OH3620_COT-345 TaxID=2491048 RepID=UPI00131528A9|nr:ERF family protein [Leptotrichia sp. OH3620_COT-345]
MNIYEKLQKARVELQEMGLKKSGYNKFANFDYFELKDFLPKVNEIFLKLKLFSKFDLLENEGILTIINSENTEEKETFTTPKIVVEMKGQNGLQQIGSTHTYLKRYCYYNALEIIINDETEATIDKDKNKEQTKTQKQKNEKTEKERKENAIKAIIDNISNLTDTEQIEVLNGKELIDLDNMNLNELKIIYKKIEEKKKSE